MKPLTKTLLNFIDRYCEKSSVVMILDTEESLATETCRSKYEEAGLKFEATKAPISEENHQFFESVGLSRMNDVSAIKLFSEHGDVLTTLYKNAVFFEINKGALSQQKTQKYLYKTIDEIRGANSIKAYRRFLIDNKYYVQNVSDKTYASQVHIFPYVPTNVNNIATFRQNTKYTWEKTNGGDCDATIFTNIAAYALIGNRIDFRIGILFSYDSFLFNNEPKAFYKDLKAFEKVIRLAHQANDDFIFTCFSRYFATTK